jgi:signal transduction histidine kinase
VEKIKQQNLDFTITYDGPDELGDLCRAVNELRSQLQASLLREWHKEEETREMVAALSHDLRTPVTTIQGYIENLAGTRPEKRTERLERYLPALESNIQRLIRLLEEMLMVASLNQSGFMLQPSPVKLEEILERKAADYALRCAEQQIAFHYQVHKLPELDDNIIVDYHRIEQVLDNLFENALRFTAADGNITLTWIGNLNVHSFSISDTGSGIAEEDLPHIFEKYYSRSRQQTGVGKSRKSMGMGLYICKELVRRHSGDITAHNREEGGCEISFWITPYTE